MRAFGETFDLKKHPQVSFLCDTRAKPDAGPRRLATEQGTEVKAVTYSAMKVIDTLDRHEVFVIIDI